MWMAKMADSPFHEPSKLVKKARRKARLAQKRVEEQIARDAAAERTLVVVNEGGKRVHRLVLAR